MKARHEVVIICYIGGDVSGRTRALMQPRELQIGSPSSNRPAMKRTVLQLVVALSFVGSLRADQTIQSVQQALTDQGFYYGNVTGEKSAETTAAVRRYQIRNGLQVTGEINSETLRSLNVASNSTSSAPLTSKSPVTQPTRVRPDDSSRLGPVLSPRSF